jgi:hypothetical protein
MKRVLLAATVALSVMVGGTAWAQDPEAVEAIKQAVPYSRMLRESPGMTLSEYNETVRSVARDLDRKRALEPAPYAAPRPLYRPPTYVAPRYTPPTYEPPDYTSRSYRSTTPDRRSGATIDPQSGNTYSWYKNYDGSTTVNGSKLQNGSIWNQRIERDGRQSGMDSKGNLWNYDAKTGSYINTDGTVCVGTGYARTCTK